MPLVHPTTHEHGVMPLSEFPEERRAAIVAAVERPDAPPRWLDLGPARMESRAWYEWHWARGQKLRRVESEQQYRSKIPAAVRGAVYARDGFACLHCGSLDDHTIDHIHPWSLGGTDEPDNLQTLCRSCNSKKGARV